MNTDILQEVCKSLENGIALGYKVGENKETLSRVSIYKYKDFYYVCYCDEKGCNASFVTVNMRGDKIVDIKDYMFDRHIRELFVSETIKKSYETTSEMNKDKEKMLSEGYYIFDTVGGQIIYTYKKGFKLGLKFSSTVS